MVRKILVKNSPGDASHFGADDWSQVNAYLSNVDQSGTDPVFIATETTFRDNKFRLWNPAMDHSIRFRTLSIGDDYDITVPDIESDDDLLLLLHDQAFQNKTINLSNGNLLKTTDIQLGDILKSDGLGYVRVPLGTADQVFKVNAAGTDAGWETWGGGAGTPSPPPPPGGPNIPDDDSVSTAKIQNNAVTTAKILDSAITNAKLAGSISGSKILDGAITSLKIGNDQVTNSHLSGSIAGSKLLSGAIGTTQLADNGVTNAKLAGSITQDKLSQITDTAKLPGSIMFDWTRNQWAYHSVTRGDAGGGIWSDILWSEGTFGYIHSSSNYSRGKWTTTTSDNSHAGWTTEYDFTRANVNPRLDFRIQGSNTEMQIFGGFVSGTDSTFPSLDSFLDNKHGIGLWISSGNTNYRNSRNNGAASNTTSDLSPATLVANGGVHSVSIYTDDAGSSWHIIFNGTDNVYTTVIPTVNQTLGVRFAVQVQGTGGSTKNFEMRYCQFKHDIG